MRSMVLGEVETLGALGNPLTIESVSIYQINRICAGPPMRGLGLSVFRFSQLRYLALPQLTVAART